MLKLFKDTSSVISQKVNLNLSLNIYCGMNDGISESCDNASSATFRVATECYVIHEMFSYMLKRRKHFGDGIETHDVMLIMWQRV
jgi:hypothetical protein